METNNTAIGTSVGTELNRIDCIQELVTMANEQYSLIDLRLNDLESEVRNLQKGVIVPNGGKCVPPLGPLIATITAEEEDAVEATAAARAGRVAAEWATATETTILPLPANNSSEKEVFKRN